MSDNKALTPPNHAGSRLAEEVGGYPDNQWISNLIYDKSEIRLESVVFIGIQATH